MGPDIDSAFAAVEAPPKPASIEQRWGIWGSAYGGKNRTAGDALIGSRDLSASAAGFAAGADYRVSPDTVIGAAVAIGETSWNLSSGLGKGKADVVQAGAYGTTRWNAAQSRRRSSAPGITPRPTAPCPSPAATGSKPILTRTAGVDASRAATASASRPGA